MQTEIPGIANTCRTSEGQMSFLFTIGDKSVYASGKYAEPSLFKHVHTSVYAGQC
jgi:hypothetical protein